MINELIEKQKRLAEDNARLLQDAKAAGKEVLDPDKEQEWQNRDAAIEALGRNIAMRRKQDQIEKALGEAETRRADPNPSSSGPPPRSSASGFQHLRQSEEDFEDAFKGWLLKPRGKATDRHLAAAQRLGVRLDDAEIVLNMRRQPLQKLDPASQREWEARAQTITTTGGGYTIPDETMRAIEVALLAFGPMREVSTIIRTETGADLPWPTTNDTNQVGEILAINTPVNPQDVVFGQMVLKAWKYSSKLVLVPVELMQDNAVNLPSLLGNLLGTRIARIQNTHQTTGAGTTLPFGIVTQATAGPAPTGSVAGGFTYSHMVDLEHSVDIAYRRMGAGFMMNDQVVARLKKLLDTAGRPIWQPQASSGMQSGAAGELLGYPYYINNDMVATQTNGSRAVIFGALSKYMIRECLGIELLRCNELYASSHQVGFFAYARMDANLLDAGTHPVKYMAYTT